MYIQSWLFGNKSRELTDAVSKGDHVGVARAIRDGADPNTCIHWEFPGNWGGKHNSVPVLTLAAYNGYDDVVTTLLEANANTEYKGDFRVAPLAEAVAWRHTNIVEKLLKHGADVNAMDSKD
ncbi:unnamed protein product, partial [Meganyctiphanes norvegica]